MKCVSQISCLLAAIACLTADLANAADRTHEEKGMRVVWIVLKCSRLSPYSAPYGRQCKVNRPVELALKCWVVDYSILRGKKSW